MFRQVSGVSSLAHTEALSVIELCLADEKVKPFLEGKTIPDATKRFLQSQSEPGKN